MGSCNADIALMPALVMSFTIHWHWIPSTGKIGGPGTEIDIPLAHKDALYARSFYDTLTISINDAPKPDEILILFAAASRSRLNARLGGLQEKDIIGKDGLR